MASRPHTEPLLPGEWSVSRLAKLPPDFPYIAKCIASVTVLLARAAFADSSRRDTTDAYRLALQGLRDYLVSVDNARRDRMEYEEVQAVAERIERMVGRLERGAGGHYLGQDPPDSDPETPPADPTPGVH